MVEANGRISAAVLDTRFALMLTLIYRLSSFNTSMWMKVNKAHYNQLHLRLTGHGEGDLLRPPASLVLSYAGVDAWISRLCWTEDQIQAVLVHPPLCGHPLTSSLPPDLGLGFAPRGATSYPLQGVCREDVRHLGHHVFYLCVGEQRECTVLSVNLNSEIHLHQTPDNHRAVFKASEAWLTQFPPGNNKVLLILNFPESDPRLIPTHSTLNRYPVLLRKVLWFAAQASVIREQSAR